MVGARLAESALKNLGMHTELCGNACYELYKAWVRHSCILPHFCGDIVTAPPQPGIFHCDGIRCGEFSRPQHLGTEELIAAAEQQKIWLCSNKR